LGAVLADWKDYLSIVADVASLISLFVAGYAAYAITRVRSQVVDRVRLPDLVAGLEKRGKTLATLMSGYDNADTQGQVLLELARCEAILRAIGSKVGRGSGGRTDAILREIARYKGSRWFGYSPAVTTREQAWRIYTDLNGLIEELKNVIEEQRMGM